MPRASSSIAVNFSTPSPTCCHPESRCLNIRRRQFSHLRSLLPASIYQQPTHALSAPAVRLAHELRALTPKLTFHPPTDRLILTTCVFDPLSDSTLPANHGVGYRSRRSGLPAPTYVECPHYVDRTLTGPQGEKIVMKVRRPAKPMRFVSKYICALKSYNAVRY